MTEYKTHHIFLIPSILVVFISANPSQLSKWRYLGDIFKSHPVIYFLNILLKSRKLFFCWINIIFFLIEYLFSKVNIMILSNLHMTSNKSLSHISSSALQTPIWISLQYFFKLSLFKIVWFPSSCKNQSTNTHTNKHSIRLQQAMHTHYALSENKKRWRS